MVSNDEIKRKLKSKRNRSVLPENIDTKPERVNDLLICPVCGTENDVSSIYCSYCGDILNYGKYDALKKEAEKEKRKALSEKEEKERRNFHNRETERSDITKKEIEMWEKWDWSGHNVKSYYKTGVREGRITPPEPKMTAGQKIWVLCGFLLGIIPGLIFYWIVTRDISRKKAEWQRDIIIKRL